MRSVALSPIECSGDTLKVLHCIVEKKCERRESCKARTDSFALGYRIFNTGC